MNRKQRRAQEAQNKSPKPVCIGGVFYSVAQADALAVQEKQRGHLEEAAAIYRLILAAVKDAAEMHNSLGNVLLLQRQPANAAASYAEAAARKPDYVEAWFNLGKALQELGRHEEALASYDKALSLAPASAVIYNNKGNSLQLLGRLPEAVAHYDKAIALQPDVALNYYNRGNTLQQMNRPEEAVASYDKAIALNPGFVQAHNNRASTLQKMKRYEEALAGCDEAIRLSPGYADAYQNRGVILVNVGRMEEAETMFLQAHALKPSFATPLFSLTNIRKYKDAHHDDVARIMHTLALPSITLRDKEYLHFSLGKIYDDCGQYDDAFDHYRQANALRHATLAYDAAKLESLGDAVIETFSKQFLAQPQTGASESETPVFVVGMPRSGTTLMASILSNHPSIGTAGELKEIIEFSVRLPDWLGHPTPYPQAARNLTAELTSRLAEHYETRLRRGQPAGKRHVVDKHPLNFRHLGFIARLFPKCTVVHCRRNPLDTALSNYFQLFSSDYDFAFDLRDIGHFYVQYEKLMRHWHDVQPLRMIEIAYEDMITDTETVTRGVLDALGLAWHENCRSPHTNPNAVETASNWQVRQPIYTRSKERWRHYDRYLTPLKEALGAGGVSFDSSFRSGAA